MERDDTISNENDGKVVSQRTGTGTEEQNACLKGVKYKRLAFL